MNDSTELTRLFISFTRRKLLEEMWPRLCSCLDQLSEDQIWWRPNETSNSIGNLLLHLNGNVRQWLLKALAGQDSGRNRDAEFEEHRSIPVNDLRARLDATLHEVDALLAKAGPEELLRTVDIQVYREVPVLEAIYHVVEHFSLHYGQILYITKMLSGADLGFYAHLRRRTS